MTFLGLRSECLSSGGFRRYQQQIEFSNEKGPVTGAFLISEYETCHAFSIFTQAVADIPRSGAVGVMAVKCQGTKIIPGWTRLESFALPVVLPAAETRDT